MVWGCYRNVTPPFYLNFVFAFMRRDFGYKFFMALINSVMSDRTAAVNVNQNFTSLGNDFFTSYGKQIFTLFGKEFFT